MRFKGIVFPLPNRITSVQLFHSLLRATVSSFSFRNQPGTTGILSVRMVTKS